MYNSITARLDDLLNHPFYADSIGAWRGRPRRARVLPDLHGCLIWQGAVNSKGYPAMRGGLVHRTAWTTFNGSIPAGSEIHHICKNKRCVRVDHLACLTRAEHAALEGRPLKLDEAAVVSILDRIGAGESHRVIAERYDIDRAYVSQIKHGKAWSRVHRTYHDQSTIGRTSGDALAIAA